MEEIRQSLSKLNGADEVVVSESIGTVTIHYDHKKHPDFAKHLSSDQSPQQSVSVQSPPRMKDLEGLDDMIEHETEFLAQHSHSAKMLLDWANGLDQGIKRATGNAVDLKVLAPLALALGAFMELGIAASTPVWLTLSLFSFNHFVDLHSHPPVDPAAGANVQPSPRPRKRRFP